MVPTVATPGEPLPHAPPGVASLSASVAPLHTFEVLAVIEAGNGFTVIISVTVQPAPNEYVIVAVPAATPEIIPDEVLIVAITGLLLLHNPPPASVAVTVAEIQTIAGPLIGPGNELTVTVFIAGQPPIV